MHYSRWRTHGTPLAPGRRHNAPRCVEDGCSEQPVAKDLCQKHYYAARRPSKAPRPPVAPRVCTIERCESRATSRGWCGAHYQRWRRFGDPQFVPPDMGARCSIEGCEGEVNARSLCGRHYYRWWTYGNPMVSKNRPRKSEPVRAFALRQCATCGRMFDPGSSSARKYCSRTCRPSRASAGINRRQTVVALARESGWDCALCGEAVNPGLYWPNLDAGSVDHLVAVVEGGSDDRSNLQLAHLRCNLAKEVRRRGR